MLNWKDASQSKPRQGERVLLKIDGESCPVVGFWGAGEWEGCKVNFTVHACAYAPHGADISDAFETQDVKYYAEIGDLPE